jgi:hypothetical protein
VRVVPSFIGRDNAQAVVGRSWRGVQDIAAALGVKPRRIGRVALYDAAELADAIRRCGTSTSEQPSDGANGGVDQDELAAMRARVARAR